MTETELAEKAIVEKLNNRAYRLNNLYWVQDEHGRKVKFKMNWAQRAFFKAMWWLNVILKARQLGMSTFMAILMLDRCLFNDDQTCGIVDKTDEDAKKKLAKIEFAYDHLDDPDDPATAPLGAAVKQARALVTNNKKELKWSNGSQVWAGTSLRGGTIQLLHISELGYIAFHDPERAKEIKTGALNTVHRGNIVVIESTHEGGKYGLNYDMIRIAQEAPDPITEMDWRFHFFAWWKHPSYFLPLQGPLVLTVELEQYFAELEKEERITLTPEQKHWYAKKHRTQGDDMLKEFPSTPEEALNAVVQGAIYGKLISKLRRERRIMDFQHDRSLPIYSFFDIGYSDYCSIWLVQLVGRDICALRNYSNTGEPAAHYANKLVEWERFYGQPILADYLPHDANAKEKGSGKSYVDFFKEAGRKTIKVVPRIPDEWVGINHLRGLLPRFIIHKTECGREWMNGDTRMPSGLAALEAYHTKTETTGGTISEKPVHDESSHASSALRTFAEAHMRGMLEGTSFTAKEEGRRKLEVKTGLRDNHARSIWHKGPRVVR
jgi:hypothetical protein